ncbi:hypothetical protein L9F63_019800, partial [Diploptera punctata]
YEEEFDKEKAVLEDYYRFLEILLNLLTLEVRLFQLRNPQKSFKAYHNMEPEQEEWIIYIPQALRACDAQMRILQKWRYGLWEGIQLATNNAQQEMGEQTCNWVTFNIAKAWKRLEFKMILHMNRYERVIREIFIVRQTELLMHIIRLEKHEKVRNMTN